LAAVVLNFWSYCESFRCPAKDGYTSVMDMFADMKRSNQSCKNRCFTVSNDGTVIKMMFLVGLLSPTIDFSPSLIHGDKHGSGLDEE